MAISQVAVAARKSLNNPVAALDSRNLSKALDLDQQIEFELTVDSPTRQIAAGFFRVDSAVIDKSPTISFQKVILRSQ